MSDDWRSTQLTVRGVKAMLSRSGVDYSALTITHDPAVRTDIETGEHSTAVVIGGSKEARRPVREALFERGLACALYSDRDEWSR